MGGGLFRALERRGKKTPAVPEGFSSSWAQYTLLWKAMREAGKPEGRAGGGRSSQYGLHYPRLLHRQTVYLPLGYEAAACRFSKGWRSAC